MTIDDRIKALQKQLKNLDGWQYRRCINNKIEKEIKALQIKTDEGGIGKKNAGGEAPSSASSEALSAASSSAHTKLEPKVLDDLANSILLDPSLSSCILMIFLYSKIAAVLFPNCSCIVALLCNNFISSSITFS